MFHVYGQIPYIMHIQEELVGKYFLHGASGYFFDNQVCPKGFPLQSYSGEGSKTINPYSRKKVWILKECSQMLVQC